MTYARRIPLSNRSVENFHPAGEPPAVNSVVNVDAIRYVLRGGLDWVSAKQYYIIFNLSTPLNRAWYVFTTI